MRWRSAYLLATGVLGAIWSYDCGPFYFSILMQMMVFALVVFLAVGFFVAERRTGSWRFWSAGLVLSLIVFVSGYVFSTHTTFRNGRPQLPGTNCGTHVGLVSNRRNVTSSVGGVALATGTMVARPSTALGVTRLAVRISNNERCRSCLQLSSRAAPLGASSRDAPPSSPPAGQCFKSSSSRCDEKWARRAPVAFERVAQA